MPCLRQKVKFCRLSFILQQKIVTLCLPLLVISFGILSLTQNVHSQENTETQTKSLTQKKLFTPYYASLRYHKTFVRSGPGRNYPVLWVYNQQHLPLEIINRLDDWLQVRDWTGDEGWILYTQTRRKHRYAIVVLEEISMYQKNDKSSQKIARLAYEVIGRIKSCNLQWCQLDIDGTQGWTRRAGLWGLYPNDTIN